MMSDTKKRIFKILAACVAGLLVAAMLAGILTFAFLQPVRPKGDIRGEDLKGDRAAYYTLETRNYFIVRLRNWVARLLNIDREYVSMQSAGDYLLRAFSQAGIPSDKVRGIADFLEAKDPSDALGYVILAFCRPAVDEDGNEIEGSYVFDVNADPSGALLALIGADTVSEFFSYTLFTPEEGGAVLYYAIYNSLSDEDKALLATIGLDRFVNLMSGFVRISTNFDSFLNGVSAQEARIMYELTYTVGADLQVFIDVLGVETIERLFGVRPSVFPFDPDGEEELEGEDLEHLKAMLEGAEGLTAFAIVTLSAFMNNLSPEIFEYYQRYTASGDRRDLVYAALLTARTFATAAEQSANTKGNIGLGQAMSALGTVTDHAFQLGVDDTRARYSLVEMGLALTAFLWTGEDVQSREDLDEDALFKSLSTQLEFFEGIESPFEIREYAGVSMLINLTGFRLLTLLLGVI